MGLARACMHASMHRIAQHRHLTSDKRGHQVDYAESYANPAREGLRDSGERSQSDGVRTRSLGQNEIDVAIVPRARVGAASCRSAPPS